MNQIAMTAGPFQFRAQLHEGLAPKTCAAFRSMLPYNSRIVHVRWSGEGLWIPMGDENPGLPFENATSYPAPGQILFYPGGYSETEILIAYGGVQFASKLGQLAANHFMTVTEGLEQLPELGRLTLWEGAQDVSFKIA